MGIAIFTFDIFFDYWQDVEACVYIYKCLYIQIPPCYFYATPMTHTQHTACNCIIEISKTLKKKMLAKMQLRWNKSESLKDMTSLESVMPGRG